MSSFPLKAENFAWHQAVDWAIKTIPRAVLQTLAHLCFMLFLTPTPPWLRDPSFSLLPDPIHITLLYLPTSSETTWSWDHLHHICLLKMLTPGPLRLTG